MGVIGQVAVVIVCVFLFIGSFLLNRKIKIKGEDENSEHEIPEGCMHCHNRSCLANLKNNEDKDAIYQIVENCDQGGKNENE